MNRVSNLPTLWLSCFRDIISGTVISFVSTGITSTASEYMTNEEVVVASAAPNFDESPWNAVLLLTVPVYKKKARLLICVTDVWREYTVGLGGNPSIESSDRL